MPDLSLDATNALELRYDGPVPTYHLENPRRARRRARGTIAVLEAQALAFLDAALRCETEMDEAAEECADSEPPQSGKRLDGVRSRLEAHIHCATDTLRKAVDLRSRLDLPKHPIFRIVSLAEDGAKPYAEQLSAKI